LSFVQNEQLECTLPVQERFRSTSTRCEARLLPSLRARLAIKRWTRHPRTTVHPFPLTFGYVLDRIAFISVHHSRTPDCSRAQIYHHAKVNSMDDYPLWANIDVIVEAHASGTGAEPPHSYAFTRCITKKVLRRTHELINNGSVARGTLLVTMARVVLIILGVRPPTEPWADADACADSRSSRAHTQRVCARVPPFRALVPLAGTLSRSGRAPRARLSS